jgi:hypothetical protein
MDLLLGEYLQRAGRIPENGDVRDAGDDLPEQFETLRIDFRRDRGQPGDVPAGMAERRNDARSYGIADRGHDQGHRSCRLLDGESGGCPGGHDHRDLQGEQLRNQGREAIILSVRPPILDHDVSALDVPVVAQPLAELPDEIGLEGHRGVSEEPDPVHVPRLLGRGGDRRREEARAHGLQEAAAIHYSRT